MSAHHIRVADRAVERCRREFFLRAANEDYKLLRSDWAAWKQVTDERELLDRALCDGLESA